MKRLIIASMLALSTLPALAQVAVKDQWVRGTVPQQKATGAFMNLQAEKDMRLVSAKSPVAGFVEIHEMAMEKDVMKMRALPSSSPWSEICTSVGTLTQAADVSPGSGDSPMSGHKAEHCPWCTGTHHPLALPVSQYPIPAIHETNEVPWRYDPHIPVAHIYRCASRPRAPPATS
jgi:hypothetical protein